MTITLPHGEWLECLRAMPLARAVPMYLRHAGPAVTVGQIMDALEVAPRTWENNLPRLKDLGVTVSGRIVSLTEGQPRGNEQPEAEESLTSSSGNALPRNEGNPYLESEETLSPSSGSPVQHASGKTTGGTIGGKGLDLDVQEQTLTPSQPGLRGGAGGRKPRAAKPRPSNESLPEPPEKLRRLKGFDAAWNAWVTHRREIRKPYTPTTAAAQLEWLLEQPDPVKTLVWNTGNGYQGLVPLRVETGHGSSPPPKASPPGKPFVDVSDDPALQKIDREIAELEART